MHIQYEFADLLHIIFSLMESISTSNIKQIKKLKTATDLSLLLNNLKNSKNPFLSEKLQFKYFIKYMAKHKISL